MAEVPVITDILTAPGLASPGEGAWPQSGEIVSLGLVLDDERVTWVECPVNDNLEATINTIQKRVKPALQGERLASFRDLVAKVDALTERVTISETLPQPETSDQAGKFSRRDLFSGRLWSPEPDHKRAPKTRQVSIEGPISAAIRYGASQALLAAVAMTRKQTMAEVIATEYSLPHPAAAVAIQAPVGQPTGEPAAALNAILPYRVAALGYTIAGSNDQDELGDHGEILQRFVSRLQAQLAAAPDAYQPVIYLDVKGAFGRLYNNDAGKILGALYGLEQAAKPYRLRVVDPAILDSHEAQVAIMRRLKEYLRLRRMRLELVAGAWIDSAGDVEAFIQAEAAHLVQVNAARLGSLCQSIEAILAGGRPAAGVLLAGTGSSRPAEVLAHLALATRPNAIIAPDTLGGLALVHNEMARTLAWLKNSNDNL